MITIVPYQERWPADFARLSTSLRAALANHAHSIHHIGSTSVPGLAAKDVIDIQITVHALEPSLAPLLEPLGLLARAHVADHAPFGITLTAADLEKRYFRSADRKIHVHVRRLGAFNREYAILFRDFLRANAMARESYAEIKRQLARYFPENIDAYYDVKDPVCDALMAGALEWKKATRWEPPESGA